MQSEAPAAMGSAIPVVDLSAGEAACAAAVDKACREVGFFLLANHGVPRQLISDAFHQTRLLFGLPPDAKAAVRQDSNNRGYTAFEEEVLDPKVQRARGDTKEGYYIGVEIPPDDPRAAKPLHGPNVWPAADLLPSFRPTITAYFTACLSLARRLLPILALALGQPRDFFDLPGRFDDPIALLRLLHYSGEASRPQEGVLGAGAHTDYGMLTLLLVSHPGLEICVDRSSAPQRWVRVPVLPGAFIVNIGDMLERWSNATWRSTLHRVVVLPEGDGDGEEGCTAHVADTDDTGSGGAAGSAGAAAGAAAAGSAAGDGGSSTKGGSETLAPGRVSLPFFFEPNFDCVVDCVPSRVDAANPARFPPTTSGHYLLSRYQATHKDLHASLR
ncbi:hypothetical protein CLOM_g15446 [Closterium sp. NIES-68]|nr:hypothetical protein CLOM_g15446 [Closterium sp. NIES-68]GJP64206.1 hypothetical protein CLOP_g21219 [Closterium sp. NIES-67]